MAGVGIGDKRWIEAHKREILQSRIEETTLLASTLGGLQRPPSVFVSGSATAASTPPGGGVYGMCGYHAAGAALRRLRRS